MDTSGKRVLVVDDAEDIRRVLASALKLTGVEVSEAEDGVEALAKLRDAPVDVVLTDCRMPRMSGAELMKAAHREMPGLRFIVVSGTAHDELDGQTPFAVVPKPFRLKDIQTAVATALR